MIFFTSLRSSLSFPKILFFFFFFKRKMGFSTPGGLVIVAASFPDSKDGGSLFFFPYCRANLLRSGAPLVGNWSYRLFGLDGFNNKLLRIARFLNRIKHSQCLLIV